MKKVLFCALIIVQFSCMGKARKQINIQKQETHVIQKSDTLSLLFVGDLIQHQAQIDAARNDSGYDYSPCFEYIKDEVKSVDWAIGNLEVTLGGKPYRGYPAFSAPDEYLYAIQNAGFNVLTTANNHCLDSGKKGLQRTIHLLDSLKIPHAGTYSNLQERDNQYPLILDKKGFRIALLNYTYGTNGYKVTSPNIVNYIDTTTIAKDILTCKEKKTDVIIACMHWGVEYQFLPNKEQIFLTDWLLKKGVNHIIGSHPHVVQPMEVRQDSLTNEKHLVVYSLGNCISNMPVRGTDGGLMVKMELVKDHKDNSTVRLNDCAYSLIWTARPVQSGMKNYQLLPVNLPMDSFPLEARNSLKIFTDDARTLFNKHNLGIKEYTFFQKK